VRSGLSTKFRGLANFRFARHQRSFHNHACVRRAYRLVIDLAESFPLGLVRRESVVQRRVLKNGMCL
jgi:hypothetical protein